MWDSTALVCRTHAPDASVRWYEDSLPQSYAGLPNPRVSTIQPSSLHQAAAPRNPHNPHTSVYLTHRVAHKHARDGVVVRAARANVDEEAVRAVVRAGRLSRRRRALYHQQRHLGHACGSRWLARPAPLGPCSVFQAQGVRTLPPKTLFCVAEPSAQYTGREFSPRARARRRAARRARSRRAARSWC